MLSRFVGRLTTMPVGEEKEGNIGHSDSLEERVTRTQPQISDVRSRETEASRQKLSYSTRRDEEAKEVQREQEQGMQEMEEKMLKYRDQRNWFKSEAKRYRDERNSLRESNGQLELSLSQERSELEELKRVNRTLRRDLDRQSQLLELRTTELRDAHAYLAKEDNVACADVVGMLQFLNSEIFQVSCQISDACKFVSVKDDQDLAHSTKSAGAHLGDTMATLVVAVRERGGDDLVLQMAIQTLLARVVADIVMAWVPDADEQKNQFTEQLYDEIYQSG
jgi:uncharacterized phage infection (PIP) family protein YhgE